MIRPRMSVTVCFSLGSLPGTFAATMRTASSSSSARRLEVFPPEFVHRPFSHLMEILKPVVGFRLKDGEQEIEVLDQPRRLIAEAAAR